MVLTLIAGLALAPAPLELSVSSASLFKNGYAVVVREAALGASGEYIIEDMPRAVLGTMWISATPGTKIESLIVTNQETTSQVPVQSIDEILQANIGKRLRLGTSFNDTIYEGELISAAGSVAVIRDESGMRAINKSVINNVSSAGELIWKKESKSTKPVMKLRISAGRNAKLSIVSLGRGLTWFPGYSLDISDPKKLRLVSKATILNDLADLPNIEVRLITGFPNVPFVGWWDPLTSRESVEQFTNQLMQMGTPQQLRERRDAFSNQMGQLAAPRGGFDEAFNISPLPGISSEDLFFYRLPNIDMKRGDRGYFILLAMESDYSHIYEWEIPDKVNNSRYVQQEDRPGDIWHSIKFKNNSNQPLTTGPATIFKDGEIMGQDSLLYTSVGAESTVKMTKAMDVRAEDFEEETARVVLEQPIRGSWYDVVTLKGTLSITNRKKEAIDLKITKDLTGEMVATDADPRIRTITRGLRAVNPRQMLEWNIKIAAGESKTITYTYKVHLAR